MCPSLHRGARPLALTADVGSAGSGGGWAECVPVVRLRSATRFIARGLRGLLHIRIPTFIARSSRPPPSRRGFKLIVFLNCHTNRTRSPTPARPPPRAARDSSFPINSEASAEVAIVMASRRLHATPPNRGVMATPRPCGMSGPTPSSRPSRSSRWRAGPAHRVLLQRARFGFWGHEAGTGGRAPGHPDMASVTCRSRGRPRGRSGPL